MKPRFSFLAMFAALVCLSGLVSSGQTKRQPKPKPKTDYGKPYETPCGVRYKNFDEFLNDIQKDWIGFTSDNSTRSFYSPKRNLCEQGGTLKVWIKVVLRDTTQRLSYTLNQYGLNCRTDKIRVLSGTMYDKNGEVLEIEYISDREKEWVDAVPETVGETILKKVCRKAL